MNVVLLNQYYAPDEAATAQMLADLGAGLASAGHNVTAICSNRSYADPSRTYPARERIDGVEIRRVKITGFGRRNVVGRAVDYLSFFVRAGFRLLREPKPDVVISLTTPPMIALLGALVARFRGARSVMWSMDVYPDVVYELGGIRATSLLGRALGILSRVTLRAQDAVVALGGHMGDRLRSAGARRVRVIHNWADEQTIRATRSSESALRREWGWGDRFVVVYSGNLGLAHEFDTVVQAAERLKNDGSILFAFIGAGPRLAAVQRQVDERRLSNVEIRKPVARDALPASLSAADVHLITLRPRMPGLLVPSKIYGILAAGRPTIYVGPSEGEVFEILTASSCGTCVANGDVDRLVEAIARYRTDAAMRATEGERARRAFDEKFTKRRGVEEFSELLSSIA